MVYQSNDVKGDAKMSKNELKQYYIYPKGKLNPDMIYASDKERVIKIAEHNYEQGFVVCKKKKKIDKCGRCGKNRKFVKEYVCKQCAEDEKYTQWGRG